MKHWGGSGVDFTNLVLILHFSWLEFPDLHGTLGVDRNATDREIRSRRRELVHSSHQSRW